MISPAKKLLQETEPAIPAETESLPNSPFAKRRLWVEGRHMADRPRSPALGQTQSDPEEAILLLPAAEICGI